MRNAWLYPLLALGAACTSYKETTSGPAAQPVETVAPPAPAPMPDSVRFAPQWAAGVEFLARGAAPAWTLTGRADQGWDLQLPNETGPRQVALTLPRQSGDTLVYVATTPTGPLALAIVAGGCEGPDPGEKSTHTVLVRTATARLRGCGRYLRPAGPLALHGQRWTLAAIAGRPVPAAGPRGAAQLQFDLKQMRLNGFTGCNRFTAAFSRQGPRLGMKPAAVTRMACTGPAASVEAAFLRQLARVQAYALRPDGLHLLRQDSTLLQFTR